MLLGCIGDDFTGSSDLANTLAKGGMRTAQYCGLPTRPAHPSVEAGIVALKTRTVPANQAVERSLAALNWLRQQGCTQFLFKYCSTFDSTAEGNIGPVADALADALDADPVLVCPAYPSLGRSVYAGHLFVGDKLLNECGMEHHPLTPMTDADIRRWLALQSRSRIGHIPAASVLKGRGEIRAALQHQREAGARFLVIDTIRDEDLVEIGAAAADLPLLTGGSGIALQLPANFRSTGAISRKMTEWLGREGLCAIISGSCSRATRAQVEHHRKKHPALEITVDAVMAGAIVPAGVAEWALRYRDGIPLIYSSADPEEVTAAQERYGKERLASAIESFLAKTADHLVDAGVARIVCAGGETSGAIVEALKIDVLEIGPEIAPGVPALAASGRELVLALKSGNFGGEDFFERAAEVLGRS
nr:3-oxo-tetronate kinase [Chelativorans sp. Marseille-P2723]